MKKYSILLCLFLGVAFLVYHFGPGQKYVIAESIAIRVEEAEKAAKKQNWSLALEKYQEALQLTPGEFIETRYKLQLAQAKTRLYTAQLPEAAQELEQLLEQIKDKKEYKKLANEVRFALAEAEYYCAWAMRLEGAPREQWTMETENARQRFRLLAEQGHSKQTKKYQKNLEATIRLARMDLSELQALPLPSQCNCSGVSQKRKKGRKQKKKRSNNGKKKPKDARGRSSAPKPDDTGS